MAPRKKTGKQPTHKNSSDEEDDYKKMMSNVGQHQKSIKKAKMLPNTEVTNILKKIQDFYTEREQARKQYVDKIFENLSTIRLDCESDYNILNKNGKKLDQVASSIMKHVEQATGACEQRLEEINEIQSVYKKQVEKLESKQKNTMENFNNELCNAIKIYEDKCCKDSRRKILENVHYNILYAIQNEE